MSALCPWPGCDKPGPGLCSRDRGRMKSLGYSTHGRADVASAAATWLARYGDDDSETLSAWRSTLVGVLGEPARDLDDAAGMAANVIRTLRADLDIERSAFHNMRMAVTEAHKALDGHVNYTGPLPDRIRALVVERPRGAAAQPAYDGPRAHDAIAARVERLEHVAAAARRFLCEVAEHGMSLSTPKRAALEATIAALNPREKT